MRDEAHATKNRRSPNLTGVWQALDRRQILDGSLLISDARDQRECDWHAMRMSAAPNQQSCL